MSMINLPIGNDGFKIGIGDSNRDGKIDFDFGIRSEAWGGGPFGFGHSGAEIGFNTQRGVYAGADYSNNNAFGSHGGGGRVFGDGGYEGGSWSNDAFGNHHQNYTNVGPGYAQSSSHGGNFYTGNYSGHQSFANPWEAGNTSYAGNSWSGASMSNHSYGNVFGQGGQYSVGTPPYVPSYGGGHYQGCGCSCARQFMFG